MEPRGLLQSDELYKYLLETSVYPREAGILKELRKAINDRPESYLSTNPDSGKLIELVLKMLNAKKTIEVGVYTGYSLLLTAMTIPDDGKVIAIDVTKKHYDDVGSQFAKKAGVEHKIDFVESQALPVLDDLLAKPENWGAFDFAFVDADRHNALNYHERLVKLVRVGGVIIHDNTLWGGTVAFKDSSMINNSRLFAWEDTLRLNKALAADPLVEICQITLGDGLTICRRVAGPSSKSNLDALG